MKMLLLAMALLASGPSAPAFAQAPNDIASKLQEGHDYSQGRRAVRHRARAARRHAARAPAPMTQAPTASAPDAPAAAH